MAGNGRVVAPMDDDRESGAEAEAAFGLIDVIEAFTAMRQEFRARSNEDRQLAEQLVASTARIGELEGRVLTAVRAAAEASRDVGAAQREADFAAQRGLAGLIADIDHHVSRTLEHATAALQRPIAPRRGRSAEWLSEQIDQQVAAEGWLGRRRAQRFAERLKRAVAEPPADAGHEATVTALRLLSERVRGLVRKAGIERIDVQGAPFDGNLMNAVEAVETSEVPAGHVAVQLSAAYRWKDVLIRDAEVHVARRKELSERME